MKNSKAVMRAGFSICVALTVALYFAGCSDKDDDDKYLAFLTPTGTGTGPGTGTGTTTITGPSITQFGITWTFDRDVTIGQFANGDYWVVGPVTIIDIDPASGDDGTGRIVNGSMINPSPTSGTTQGYDSELYETYHDPGEYDPALNVARPNDQNLTAGNPLVVQAGSSLVSTISILDPSGTAQLQTAAVLTVLGSPAPDGSFRPPYVNVSKDIRFNKSQLDYTLLSQLAPVAGAPRLAQQAGDEQGDSVERMFERPWLEHVPGWKEGFVHPIDNMDDYGREICTQIGTAALMLHLDFTDAEKETLLIRFVQYGIDLYGVVQDGGKDNWMSNGGIKSGRKWPVLFAGLVLNDSDMKDIGQKSGAYLYTGGYGPGNAPPDYIHFGEDDQTFYVAQFDVDTTHSPQWNPDTRDAEHIPYEVADIGRPEWAIRHSSIPEMINMYWGTAYRTTTGGCWAGIVLAAHIMGAKELWNHDALFDYQDRYMDVELQVHGEGNWQRQMSDFLEDMWDTYRADYRPVWVRNNPADIYSLGYLEY